MVDAIKKNAKNYVISNDMTRITVPAEKFKKGRVDQIINRLYERGMKLFGKFGNVISIDKRDPYNPAILIHPTRQLIDAYEVKAGNKTLQELNAQPVEDLTDYYMGDQALREQAERELNQEILLYLSNELNDKFGFNNPVTSSGPSIEDIISRSTTITQADIDNKKLDC